MTGFLHILLYPLIVLNSTIKMTQLQLKTKYAVQYISHTEMHHGILILQKCIYGRGSWAIYYLSKMSR
jgi:hypothetical protein